MTTREVTWTEASARRLRRQGLVTPAQDSPARITAAMLGAHAQVLSAAELSVALRLDGGANRTGVREALWTERSLVKTYGPRGTVHLLAAEDMPMWTGALSAIPTGSNPMPPDVRMTDEQTEQVLAAIGDALTGAELTIDELTEAIVERTGPWAGDRVMEAFQDKWPRWRQATHLAAHRGLLAFAPNRGRKATCTNPGVTPMEGPAALEVLLEHYLRAYGPATPAHFAKWLAAPRSWAAGLFASSATDGRIEEVAFAGERAWVAAGDTGFADEAPRGVRLLPYFDAFTIASQPRSCSSRAPPAGGRSRAVRPGTSPSSSSTERSAGCGTRSGRGSGSRSRSSRWGRRWRAPGRAVTFSVRWSGSPKCWRGRRS